MQKKRKTITMISKGNEAIVDVDHIQATVIDVDKMDKDKVRLVITAGSHIGTTPYFDLKNQDDYKTYQNILDTIWY